jgi:hypothetical protein
MTLSTMIFDILCHVLDRMALKEKLRQGYEQYEDAAQRIPVVIDAVDRILCRQNGLKRPDRIGLRSFGDKTVLTYDPMRMDELDAVIWLESYAKEWRKQHS